MHKGLEFFFRWVFRLDEKCTMLPPVVKNKNGVGYVT